MSIDKTTLSITLLGFQPVQKTIISTLMTLSKKRSIQYEISESSDVFESDVLMLDVHDELVMESWAQLKDIVGDHPVIAVGEHAVTGASHSMKRAEIAARLLSTLDEIATGQASTDRKLSPPASGETSNVQPAIESDSTSVSGSQSSVHADTVTQELSAAATEVAPAAQTLAGQPVAPEQQPEPVLTTTVTPPSQMQPQSESTDMPSVDADTAVQADSVSAAMASSAQSEHLAPSESATESVEGICSNESPASAGDAVSEVKAEMSAPVFGSNRPASYAEEKQWPIKLVEDEDRKHELRALVVDDTKAVWAQMEICLDTAPVDVDFVSTAEDCLNLMESRTYGVVFMDVMLPGIDGYIACKKIKTNDDLKKTPVVMLTSKASPANKAQGVLAGCNYYLTKPVVESEVKAVIRRFVKVTDSVGA